MPDSSYHALTRRKFVAAGAAAFSANVFSAGARAQTAAKFRRHEISDPSLPTNVVSSYKKAVTAMLQLPPTDPRNWYRNAFTHIFDCPHGNWWFLAWHRAYIGWFERKCRELSGDDTFALPYWDWTTAPRIPSVMFEDALDPHNSLFIASFDAFKQHFNPAVKSLFRSFSPAQKGELAHRGLTTSAAFWTAAQDMFFDRANSRGLTASNPDFDSATKKTVAIATIRSALRATTFTGFSSGKSANHSGSGTKGILESQPHDNVHGAIGGPGASAFMVSFLSPVDPIFFVHHANLDRLWDVWTRRQKALGRPNLPQGADLAAWSNERFRFYVDEKGQPVTKTSPSDYEAMSVFDYDYAPGSGEDQVPAAAVAAAPTPPAAARRTFSANVTARSLQANATASASASVPAEALRAPAAEAPPAVAEISINVTSADEGRRFRVLISPEGGGAPIEAGAITIFGHHAAHKGPTTFSIPLPEELQQAIAPSAAGASVPLNISVVPIEQPGLRQRATARARALAPQGAQATGPAVTAVQIRTP